MNALKRGFILFWLQRMPAVSVYEICDKMRPYLKPYRLCLTETEIRFPETIRLEQFYTMRGDGGQKYNKGIPYRDIIIVEQRQQEVTLFLRSGHVFVFNHDHPIWKVTNVYPTPPIDQRKK